MGNFHHIEHSLLHQPLNPRLGENVRLLPIFLRQVSVGGYHSVLIFVSKVEVIIL
jgi:hypothetical protein